MDDAPQCLLGNYDGLRDAVTRAMFILANGFLSHPKNGVLRDQARDGRLSVREFYRQLLYFIYRLLFLMVAEERCLLPAGVQRRVVARLRAMADEPLGAQERFDNLYMGLRNLFHASRDERSVSHPGIPPLNGELFKPLPALENSHLNNRDLLGAIASLCYFTPLDGGVHRRINYAALDVRELGGVYESLLDFQPRLTETGGRIAFDFIEGTERKTTGSYYTRPELVKELIRSALEPVMEERLGEVEQSRNAGSDLQKLKEKALLSLRICDPACGSGHFLLAAARRVGRELARIRTGDDEPAPEDIRPAVRDVITHCIYGVDKDPLAVDLCRAVLWIEGHSAGRPLTFLDHRIRCGDSLLGVPDLAILEVGIPDKAFDPVAWDDKIVALSLKRRNREERSGEQHIRPPPLETASEASPPLERGLGGFSSLLPFGTRDSTACHLWTAAFLVQLTWENDADHRIPTTDSLSNCLEGRAVDGRLVENAWTLAQFHRFFHWPLEFPEIFTQGGFDVILGNPPYDVIRENRYLRSQPAGGAGNLFAHFVASSISHVAPSGSLAFVVPLSFACGETFENIRRALYQNFGLLRVSHYGIRPAKLFPHAEQRITLLRALNRGHQPCQVYSTRLHRWRPAEERKVIERAQFGLVGAMSSGLIPKVAGDIGATIYSKIKKQPCRVREWLSNQRENPVVVYYHTIARYWIKAYDFVLFFQRDGEAPGISTTIRAIALRDRTAALRFLALVNSSLFYYWWMTQSDEFHVLPSEILEFGIPAEDALWPSDEALAGLVDSLMKSYKKNAVRRRRRFGGRSVTYDEFRPRRSLQDIHAIDNVVADVYRLTDEENMFLKTYDLEFRTDEK